MIPIPKPDISFETKERVSKILGFGFIGFIATLVTMQIIIALIKYGIITTLFYIGIIVGMIGLSIGMVFLGSHLNYKYQDWRSIHPKEDRQNLLIEFIKAKKNKHCPLVKWV